MQEFNHVLDITNKLLGPGGCPWDQEQTLKSIRSSVLEEVCELIDEINKDDNAKICDELGDLFFNVIFLCQLAEKEGRFTMKDVLLNLADKLIRRHPHVFGEAKIDTTEELLHQWEKIKKSEKGHHKRKSALDGIPKSLSSLARAQKMVKKISRTDYIEPPKPSFESEEELGELLWQITSQAQAADLEADLALRHAIVRKEKAFRSWEK